jgi:rhomboid protease GluP
LARRIGPAAAAWISLGSGALGNALTAVVVRRGYVSVGASTAVFGMLGALAMLQVVVRRRMLLLAAGAASALLGLLGTGHDADLFAHLFGCAAGAILGLPAGRLALNPPRRTFLQPLLALGTLALLAICWRAALRG